MNLCVGNGVSLRPIERGDDASVASLIRSVMTEFGATGEGFSLHDPEVREMSTAYAAPRSEYWVLESKGELVGGAGFAPLAGAAPRICELRKMYFLPSARGAGTGRRVLEHLLHRARAHAFEQMYLESLTAMDRAVRLYRTVGFEELPGALGATGHTACNRFMVLDLRR